MSHNINLPEYNCPICFTNMTLSQRTLTCESGHSFDYAKEGYVHLLPVQLKKSLHPGDDKSMVLARRNFLQRGHYDFLQQALLEKVKQQPNQNVLDLGCGEGFYTSYIEEHTLNSKIYGVDISKDAIKYAAKRNKNVHYSVATNAHTPFSEQQFDLIINIFAPLIGKECKRILNAHGKIISVAPASDHLIELKQHIYQKPERHLQAKVPEGFSLESSKNIRQVINITQVSDLKNLLTMTPLGWKTSEQTLKNILTNLPFKLTLDFMINELIIDL